FGCDEGGAGKRQQGNDPKMGEGGVEKLGAPARPHPDPVRKMDSVRRRVLPGCALLPASGHSPFAEQVDRPNGAEIFRRAGPQMSVPRLARPSRSFPFRSECAEYIFRCGPTGFRTSWPRKNAADMPAAGPASAFQMPLLNPALPQTFSSIPPERAPLSREGPISVRLFPLRWLPRYRTSKPGAIF